MKLHGVGAALASVLLLGCGDDDAVGPLIDAGHSADANETVADAGGTSNPEWVTYDVPAGRKPGATNEHPGGLRMMLARSEDGVSFTRDGIVLADQGNTPNMIVMPDGEIRVYYTGASVDGDLDGLAVAISDDDGGTWMFYELTVEGARAGAPPLGDPDVLRLEDGTFRLYFTRGLDSGNNIGIHYAEGTDGVLFEYRGVASEHTSPVIDSLTAHVGQQYVQYTLDPADDANMHVFTSTDGTMFEHTGRSLVMTETNPSQPVFLSNWLEFAGDGFWRIYAFDLASSAILSLTTTDGTTLELEEGTRLDGLVGPDEYSWVKDPAVGRLSDGTYLMVYVTEIDPGT